MTTDPAAGNWLRDYSQGIDVATAKHVSAEAVRLLISVLAFLTFGYGSKEFEVTAERLGKTASPQSPSSLVSPLSLSSFVNEHF